MTTVAEQFARTLKEIGVRYVFGVPSGNMIDYMEALRKEAGIDFILVGHESTAAFMAGVCGRLTGVPGVCFGTLGPGATNLATGVGGALLDRFPLIAFTDEMPEHLIKRTVQMNIDHQQLFFPITKWTSKLNRGNVREIILKAAGIALSEMPGPVHIGVPTGIGGEIINESMASVNYLVLEKKRWSPIVAEQIPKIKEHWLKSKKPVLAVGLSAVRAGVQNKIIELSEKFRLPVILTPMAKGLFPEDHQLYAGVLFHALSNIVAETYSEADLVIGVGYDPVEFNYEDWMPNVPLIHMDNNEADIDRSRYPNVLNVKGSIENALLELLKLKTSLKNWDVSSIKERKEKLFRKLTSVAETFGPMTIIDELRKFLPENGILTVDVGAHLHLAGQMWRTPSPEKLLMTNGWSSMGFAIPAALAAKLCFPNLPVAALIGDGGFYMTVGELITAKQLNLKIVFVVIYDKSLSLIRIKQEKKKYNHHYGTDLPEILTEPTNHYFGVPVIRANSKPEYVRALEKAFNNSGPVVVEVVVDGREYDKLVLQPNKI